MPSILKHARVQRTILLAIAMLGVVAGPAPAQEEQSLADLRRENDQLRQRIARLEAQLAEAKREAELARREADALRTALQEAVAGGAATPAPGQNPPANQDQEQRFAKLPDNDPYAAPEALLQALKDAYLTEFAGVPMDTPEAVKRAAPEVRRWVGRVGRELRGQVDWLVQVKRVIQDARGRDLVEVVVVDPATGLPYDVQPVAIDARRFVRAALHDRNVEYWRINGDVRATPSFTDRLDPGLFDKPRFIGKMAEFGMVLNVKSVEAAVAPQPAQQP